MDSQPNQLHESDEITDSNTYTQNINIDEANSVSPEEHDVVKTNTAAKKAKSGKTTNVLLIIITIVSIVAACILGFLLISSINSGDGSVPVPLPTMTGEGEVPGLCLINGKLLVGTSADYPPFESYSNNFQLEGLDIAIIKQISARTGIPLELQDMAFEGLGNALKLGQINAAISAISVTPEREALFSFSNVYLVSQEGILASTNSGISQITTTDQIASRRVGVQKGSIYERWVTDNLVSAGLMPPSNLFTYITIDQAINDLIGNKIELVILDYGPAKNFSDQGSAKLVSSGMSQQRYAIGLDQNCPALLSLINNSLTQMQNDGTLSLLIQQYLGINPDENIPLPTPVPSTPVPPTPVPLTPVPSTPFPTTQPTPIPPPPACIDGMAFVKDLTYPDNNMNNPPTIQAGTPFQKGWRILNTGTCTWNSHYYMDYVGGNSPYSRMGGQATPIIGSVQPGSTYDLYINLVSPVIPGIYQGFWELKNIVGQSFGNRLWVGIEVPPVNVITPTPVPGIPQIYRFQVTPEQIQIGQCVQINWEVNGQITTTNIFRDGNPVWVDGPSIGTLQDCPPLTGTVTYEIQTTGPGGTARQDKSIQVMDIIPPTATPPPQPPPVIQTFVVQPEQILQGACVEINWEVNGTIQYIQLSRNNAVILDNVSNIGKIPDCPPEAGNYIYRLDATGAGQSTFSERAIVVNAQPQPPAFVNLEWVLMEYTNGQILSPVIPGTQTTIQFMNNGTFDGLAGCNQYSGRYTASETSLTIVVEATSKRICSEPAGLMEQEATYLQILQRVAKSQMTQGELILFDFSNNPLLRYFNGPTPK